MCRFTRLFPVFTILLIFSCDFFFIPKIDVTQPGNYEINRSYDVIIPVENGRINVMLNTFIIQTDLNVSCNFIWTISCNAGYSITKYSDAFNNNMHLEDNTGKIYYMTNTIAAAGESVTLTNGQSCTGAFIFGPIDSNITSLKFVDGDQNKEIVIF